MWNAQPGSKLFDHRVHFCQHFEPWQNVDKKNTTGWSNYFRPDSKCV